MQDANMRSIRRRNRVAHAHRVQGKRVPNNSSIPSLFRQNSYITTVKLPDEFSVTNIEISLKFVNDTFASVQEQNISTIRFDLSGVIQIDMMAICWLLSLINKIASYQVDCFGNFPDNQDTLDFVKQSGFLDVMKSKLNRASQKSFQNQMYMIGKGNVDSVRLAQSVKENVLFLMGEEDHYPPVYNNLVEICANSVEHANKTPYDKNWLVSISYSQDKVLYILTDTGLGILSTLKRKMSDLFNDVIHFKQDTEVLKGLFEGLYQSQTGEINRHKGLPEIYESFTEGWISNLQVLTNCVLYDFENQQKEILKNEFKGVMISWTLTKHNIEKWKKSLLEY